MKDSIFGHHFYDYNACPQRIYLDIYGDRNKLDEEPKFLQLLWEKGIQHEKRVIEDKSFEEVPFTTYQEGYELTYELMKKGVNLIYQGILIHNNCIGNPDLLERKKGSSKFGNYYYVPVDIKSGSGYEDKERGTLKKHYGWQLYFYASLLEKVQGVNPGIGKIINIEGEEVVYPLKQFSTSYNEVLNEIKEIILKKKNYGPCLSGDCALCHWQSYCEGWAKSINDLSLIFYLGWSKKQALKDNGIHTVNDIAQLDIKGFLKENKIKGIGEKTLNNYHKRSKVILNGNPTIYKKIPFPQKEIELFFDTEDDPTQEIYYLFGILKRTQGKEEYLPFLAERPEDEGKAWSKFWKFIETQGDYVVYYYSSHEKTVLNKLKEKYGVNDKLWDNFFDNALDIYQEAIFSNIDFPLHSYSLKRISKFLGFSYSESDASGARSIYWYSQYLLDPISNKHYLDKIIQYNKEDCEALRVIKDWIAKNN